MTKVALLTCFVLLCLLFLGFTTQQETDFQASIERGREVYLVQCMACHQQNGEGLEDIYPPLAKSEYLMEDKTRSIDQILHGMSGEIVVNGKKYNGEMTPFDLSDEAVADVLNYIRNSWGNKGEMVRPQDVKSRR